MGFREFSIDAVHGKGLQEFAARSGLQLDQYACASGIPPGVLGQLGRRISLAAYAGMLDSMASASHDDCFGLRFGNAFMLGDAGPFGLALINAPTVGNAIGCYDRYLHLIADTPFHDVSVANGTVTVSWRYWPIIARVHHFVDFRTVLLVRLLRNFLGRDWQPDEVRLVRPAPRSQSLHRASLSAHVEFGSRMNCVQFSSSLMEVKSPNADRRLFEFLLNACGRESAELARSNDLLDVVQEHILAELPSRTVSLRRIAEKLKLSERTLQRRLSSRNASLESLTDEIRRELSDRLLATQQLPLDEVGFLCGYASAAAYSRAARRWYGKAPGERRKLLRQTPN